MLPGRIDGALRAHAHTPRISDRRRRFAFSFEGCRRDRGAYGDCGVPPRQHAQTVNEPRQVLSHLWLNGHSHQSHVLLTKHQAIEELESPIRSLRHEWRASMKYGGYPRAQHREVVRGAQRRQRRCTASQSNSAGSDRRTVKCEDSTSSTRKVIRLTLLQNKRFEAHNHSEMPARDAHQFLLSKKQHNQDSLRVEAAKTSRIAFGASKRAKHHSRSGGAIARPLRAVPLGLGWQRRTAEPS